MVLDDERNRQLSFPKLEIKDDRSTAWPIPENQQKLTIHFVSISKLKRPFFKSWPGCKSAIIYPI